MVAAAQMPTSEVLLVRTGGTAPGAISWPNFIYPGEDEGWVTYATERGPTIGSSRNVYYGELSDDDPLGPRVLRRAQGAGANAHVLGRAWLADRRLGYVTVGPSPALEETAWVEDTELVSEGDAFGPGGVLFDIVSVHPVPPDRAIVVGRVRRSTGGDSYTAVEYPSGSRVVGHGQWVPVTSDGIERVHWIDVSPSGNHVVATARLAPSGREVVLLDGVVHSLRGNPAVVGASAVGIVDPEQYPGTPTLASFTTPTVTDEGVVTLRVRIDPGGGAYEPLTFVRGGRAVRQQGPLTTVAVDGLGGIVETRDEEARYEGVVCNVTSRRIDADDDGDPELNVAIWWNFTGAIPSGSGRLYSWVHLTGPGSPWDGRAILRSTLKRGLRRICVGEPNSEGLVAHLDAVGSPWERYNHMQLVAFSLPPHVTVLPQVSLTPSSPVALAGSEGSLCLGGTIGRLDDRIATSDFGGSVSAALDLDRIPVGGGFTAAAPGDTWYAQLWYRDSAASSPTSNFTDAIAIDLR